MSRTFFPIISATIKEENCIAKGQWKKQHIKKSLLWYFLYTFCHFDLKLNIKRKIIIEKVMDWMYVCWFSQFLVKKSSQIDMQIRGYSALKKDKWIELNRKKNDNTWKSNGKPEYMLVFTFLVPVESEIQIELLFCTCFKAQNLNWKFCISATNIVTVYLLG